MKTRAEMRTWRITHDHGAGWEGEDTIRELQGELGELCNMLARGANFKKDTRVKGLWTITTVAVFKVTFNPHIQQSGRWYYYPHFTEQDINPDSDSKVA